jgi:hypothetical protein
MKKTLVQEISDEEFAEMSIKKNRNRYTSFPDRLPAKDRYPYPPDEHKLIGMFESKQDLYLLLAHSYNRLMNRTDYLLQENDRLRAEVESLKKNE